MVLEGGYRALVNLLADRVTIRTGEPVWAVRHTADRATVVTSERTFEADRVVVTVPLGVLKAGEMAFDPALSRPKADAIRRLGFGRLEKVVLRFGEAWWPPGTRRFMVVRDDRAFPAWADLTDHAGAPTLVGFHGAGHSEAAMDLTDDEIVRLALGVIGQATGLEVPAPSSAHVTRWQEDPYARGSYSYLAVGSGPEDMRALARAEGKVHFGGEATDPEYFGTVHGAFVSGVRVAREILGTDTITLTCGIAPDPGC
ncbi:MAG: FAD-dependent oxidoreductase [Acidimicrobiia bacterium]|nr:FAD-dependent oxidoreductase [Acidimicrobiia bacterium]